MEADARQRVPQLSDFQEGSVVRSLLESFSVELALLYEQLDLVYQSGFVDTASGPDLDRVVAVLGLNRNEPDFATGVVTFSRDPGSNVEVTIPIATLVTTEEKPERDPPKKAYLTTEGGHHVGGPDLDRRPHPGGRRGPPDDGRYQHRHCDAAAGTRHQVRLKCQPGSFSGSRPRNR